MLPLNGERSDSIEGFYERLDELTQRLRQSGKSLATVLARLAKESRAGRLKFVARSVVDSLRVVEELRTSLTRVDSMISEFGLRSLDNGETLREVLDQTKRIGLADVYLQSGSLISFPVKIVARNGQLSVGGKNLDSERPSIIAKQLKEYRDGAESHTEGIIEATFLAYELLAKARQVAMGEPIAISDIYARIAPLPATRKQYTESTFITDLYWHIRAGQTRTKSGHVFRLSGSTTTSGGRGYRIIARDGSEVVYSMIEFGQK